jgi:phosphoglycerate dehydrogenase-like enzyme
LTPSAARASVAVLDVLSPTSREQVLEAFGSRFDVVFNDGSHGAKKRIAAGATALLAGWDRVDADVIGSARVCRVIQKLGIGTDKIDVEAARREGVAVLRAAGVNSEAVAEMAVLLTLAVLRRLIPAVETVRIGKMAKEELRASAYQLLGKTVGVVGAGHIGRAAARRFAAFDTTIVYFDVARLSREVEHQLGMTYVELDELVAKSDIVTLHLPLTDETRHLFDRRLLARMKPSTVLVNTARGGLVDEAALVDALASRALLGAGLDVTEDEPLSPESPLLALENVIVTPHYAAAVADNFPRVVRHAYRNVTSVLDGAPVSPEDVVWWPGT